MRAKIGGVTDELAFAPSELTTTRSTAGTRPARTQAGPAGPPPSTPRPAGKSAKPANAALRSTTSRRPGPNVPVKITLASTGANWTVTADRGARTLVRTVGITPGTVTAIAALLGNPSVIEAVAAVNDAARGEAEARAEQLREELAKVQAVLDGHRTPRSGDDRR